MKTKRMYSLLLLSMLAASFAFAAGEKEPVAATASGEPIYGGTLTVAGGFAEQAVQNWDPNAGWWRAYYWTSPFMPSLLKGDIEKYGPRGTNQFAFGSHADMPDEFLVGDIADTWKITSTEFVFHIRKEAMWSGNDRIGMKPRQITADDVAAAFNRFKETPIGQGIYAFVKRIYVKDKENVVFELNNFDYTWNHLVGRGIGGLFPPEVVKAGIDKWENHVSGGPFMITDYVEGSAATYVKNAGYWEKTTVKGKEYKVPFIDKLVYPILSDESTKIASIRTGKIDLAERIKVQYKETFQQTAPKLNIKPYNFEVGQFLAFQCRQGKFADENLRRAMMIATDLKAISQAVYKGEAEIHGCFLVGSKMHTPIDKLPERTKLLFTYNPELAKKMIADAGYPNGFTMELIMQPAIESHTDMAEIIASQWAKVGVTVNIKAVDPAAHAALRTSYLFPDAYMQQETIGSSEPSERITGHSSNTPGWSDKWYDENYAKVSQMTDSIKRDEAMAPLVVRYVDSVNRIQMPCPYPLATWWPWVVNYYGETECGYMELTGALARLWIDPKVKKDLGF